MTKDDILKNIFDAIAMRVQEGASKFLKEGNVYYCTGCAVYLGMPSEEEQKIGDEIIAYSADFPKKDIASKENLAPEVMLAESRIPLPDSCLDYLSDLRLMPVSKPPSGEPALWLMQRHKDATEVKARVPYVPHEPLCSIPMCLYALIPELKLVRELGSSLEDMQCSIMVARISGTPVVMLTGETSMLYSAIRKCGEAGKKEAMLIQDPAANMLYAGDAWDDKTCSYKSLRTMKGNKKMKALINPLRKPANTKPAAMPEEEQEQAAPVTTPQEEAVAAVKLEDDGQGVSDVVVAEEPATVEAAPAEAEQEAVTEAAPVQRKRKAKEPVKIGLNLTTTLEELGAPVTALNASEFDAALEEARQLRDLLIAASRRLANITIEMHKASKDSVQKMDALKTLFEAR